MRFILLLCSLLLTLKVNANVNRDEKLHYPMGTIMRSMGHPVLLNDDCCLFPLAEDIQENYLLPEQGLKKSEYGSKGHEFGAVAFRKRLRAGALLVTKEKAEVFSVTDGEVIGVSQWFRGSYSITVDHGGFVARYGRIDPSSIPKEYWRANITNPIEVNRGDVIGHLMTMWRSELSALNFEMYSGEKRGSLTQIRKPFMRRADLIDPTNYLNGWEKLEKKDDSEDPLKIGKGPF